MLKYFLHLTIIVMTGMLSSCMSESEKPVTSRELREHVTYLASDALAGRKPGTKGDSLTTHYIRDQFRKAGLKLLADDGFQSFEVINAAVAGKENHFSFAGQSYQLNQDFTPLSFSADKALGADVVFAGYGFDIQTDSIHWNDYRDLDVTGKWVMVLRGDPEPNEPESFFIPYAQERSKVVSAIDHQAGGVLFVTSLGLDEQDVLPDIFYDKTASQAAIPVLVITRKLANNILSKQHLEIAQLENKLNQTKQPLSQDLNVRVEAQADVDLQKETTHNVIGMVAAENSDSYVVVGAHHDHLGMGGPGSGSRQPDTVAVHNGADDNASGVAGVIELAERLAGQKKQLKQNIIFMTFAGEEMGLLGSKYFTKHPVVDKEKITAMINFDMIGRLDSLEPTITVGGMGTAKEFPEILKKHHHDSLFVLKTNPDGYGPSDHAAFYSEDIPVLFFSTGAHADYHTPRDDASLINFNGEKTVLDYAYNVLAEVANADSLTFKESGSKMKSRHGRRLKVTFGIIPDYAGNTNSGLGVDGVKPNGPAGKGGMRKGDIIVAIEGKPVGDIYEYMHRLQSLEPNHIITVDIIRNGKKKVLLLNI